MIAAVLALQLAQATPAAPSVAASPSAMSSDAAPGDGTAMRLRQAPAIVVPPDAARISNSGSTNMAGYVIVVSPSGDATLYQNGTPQKMMIPKTLATQLFTDLSASSPLSSAGARGCMKSASFGSTTQVFWHEQTSGDLSCGGGDERALAIAADVRQIVQSAGVRPGPRRRLLFGPSGPMGHPNAAPIEPSVASPPAPAAS